MIDRLLFSLAGIRSALMRCSMFSFAMGLLIMGQALLLTISLTALWYGQSLESQLPYLAGFAACFIARQIIENIQGNWLDTYATTRADEFRVRLLELSFAEGRTLLQQQGTGNFATLLIEGIDRVEAYIRMVLPRMTRLTIVPIMLLVLILISDWVSGIIALLVFPAIILQMVLIGHTASLEAGKQHREYQRLANHFIDSLRGIDTLKLFGRSRSQTENIYESSERFRKATMKTLRVATLSGAVLDAFSTISIAAIAVMLGFRLVDGSLALFPALFVLVLIPDYFKPIREFASDYHASLDGKNALRTITELLEGNSFDAEVAPSAEASMVDPLRDPDLQVELRDISLVYDSHNALQNISLTLSETQKIGIIGPSGAGKSTLTHILAGLTSPTSGSIVLDGSSVTSLERDDWRAHVAYIPQNPHIFHASLRDNLTFYHPDASQDAVNQVVKLMELDSLVKSLPHGLDTIIGEGAHALSGGQEQRIAFARAFLHPDCRVLIFDEPTAHLDIETELELKARMIDLMEGKLVILATHRLHWLPAMDTVVLLREGKLAAQGSLSDITRTDAFMSFIAQSKGVRHE
ncbi:MAG: thiol reductant ABC exporter subunit CydD [Eggerthellaceae bacterium]